MRAGLVHTIRLKATCVQTLRTRKEALDINCVWQVNPAADKARHLEIEDHACSMQTLQMIPIWMLLMIIIDIDLMLLMMLTQVTRVDEAGARSKTYCKRQSTTLCHGRTG
jgi:hypothetical protein